MVFFFSSRRRHTRFDCDWSSDVCSSDLHRRNGTGLLRHGRPQGRAHHCRLGMAARALSRAHPRGAPDAKARSEEHTSELQSQSNLVCRLLLEKKKKKKKKITKHTEAHST